jgi:hypothetical protein
MSNSQVLSMDRLHITSINLVVKGKASRNAMSHRNPHNRKLTIVSAQKKKSLLRHLTVTATMFITDDETFGSDERGSATQTVSAFLSGQLPQNLLHLEKGVGGEVRVELDLVAQATSNGDVLITGIAKLFEGTSENTTDLDGVRNFNALVPKNQFASFQVNIKNDDEGGDHAEIFLNFTNLDG